jgi:hypothetical protein
VALTSAIVPECHPVSPESSCSNQVSSCPGATKNRQPGGSARKGRTWGKSATIWRRCTGRKKWSSVWSISPPDQMYQPEVPEAGVCRKPLIGRLPRLPSPAIKSSEAPRGSTPISRHTRVCSIRIEASLTIVRVHLALLAWRTRMSLDVREQLRPAAGLRVPGEPSALAGEGATIDLVSPSKRGTS